MKKDRIPHDSIFKKVFEDVNAVIEFIDNFLPIEIAALIDKSKLVRDNESYLTKALRKQFADIVYKTTLEGRRTILILLFEHKKDKKGVLPFQLFQYQMCIWALDFKNKRPFSIIIPIVIFHGDKVTESRPFSSYFEFQSEITNAFIPEINYIFLNIKKESDDKLFSLPTFSGLRTLFILFKHLGNKNFLIRNMLEILKMGNKNENNDDLLSQMLLYLFTNSDIDRNVVSDIIDSQPEEAIKKMGMTTAQQWKRDGKIEGKIEREIEIIRNAWEEGFSLAQIVKISKMPIEKVKELLTQFEKEAKS